MGARYPYNMRLREPTSLQRRQPDRLHTSPLWLESVPIRTRLGRRVLEGNQASAVRLGHRPEWDHLSWLAKYLGMGERTLFTAVQNGYKLKYPKIRMTTAEHFLERASREDADPGNEEAAEEKLRDEIARIRG